MHRAGPGQPGVDDSRRYRVMRAADRLLVGALFRVRVEGLKHWPRAPFCIILNHHNAWDPLIVLALTPATPRITWFGPRVADFSRGFNNRVMGYFGGVIPIDPEKATLTSAVRAVRRVFASGGVLGIFAEGHGAFRESALDPFEDGAVVFASTAQVPVVPCVVVGTTYLWLGKRIRVSFGEPISTGDARDAESRRQVTEHVRAAMQAMLPPIEPGPPGRRPLRRFLTDVFHDAHDVARRVEALGE